MVEHLKINITTQGHQVINKKPTRNVGSLLETESCLDYIITNKVENMINHQNVYPTFSDHSLLIYRKRAKPKKITRNYLRIRKMSNFSTQQYQQEIIKKKNVETLHGGPQSSSSKYCSYDPKFTWCTSSSPENPDNFKKPEKYKHWSQRGASTQGPGTPGLSKDQKPRWPQEHEKFKK